MFGISNTGPFHWLYYRNTPRPVIVHVDDHEITWLLPPQEKMKESTDTVPTPLKIAYFLNSYTP